MTERERQRDEYELTPEDEKKFEKLGEAVTDAVASLDVLLAPGDRFPLHPGSFEDAAEFTDDVTSLPDVIRAFAFRELGVTPQGLTTARESGSEKWYATARPDVLVGTDGADWWLEIKK